MKDKQLKNKKGVDYHGKKGTIIRVERFEKWKKLKQFDTSGWLEKKCWKQYNLKKKDKIVAFKYKDGTTQVFTLGNGSVELIEETNKKNKKDGKSKNKKG